MQTQIKGTLSFDSIPYGHDHVIRVLRLQMNTSRYFCCHTYKPKLLEHVRETCYGPHSVMSQDYQNRQLNI